VLCVAEPFFDDPITHKIWNGLNFAAKRFRSEWAHLHYFRLPAVGYHLFSLFLLIYMTAKQLLHFDNLRNKNDYGNA